MVGRSQAVRQRILIPPCGGSNPPAPASAKASSLGPNEPADRERACGGEGAAVAVDQRTASDIRLIHRHPKIAFWLCACALIYLIWQRCPTVISHAAFWAEDGWVWVPAVLRGRLALPPHRPLRLSPDDFQAGGPAQPAVAAGSRAQGLRARGSAGAGRACHSPGVSAHGAHDPLTRIARDPGTSPRCHSRNERGLCQPDEFAMASGPACLPYPHGRPGGDVAGSRRRHAGSSRERAKRSFCSVPPAGGTALGPASARTMAGLAPHDHPGDGGRADHSRPASSVEPGGRATTDLA